MIGQGTVGPVQSAVGANPPGGYQQGKQAEVITSDWHGRKYTATYNGVLYVASIGSAGVAPGTALSTTPPLSLWNPANSGVGLEILKLTCGYLSGTLGAGLLVHLQGAQGTKPTGGTALTAQSGQLGNSKSGAGQPFTGSTLLQNGTILRPSAIVLSAALASTAVPWPPMVEDIDGEFIVQPGNTWAIQGITAAGSTPLVLLGVTWAEFLL